MNEKTKNEKLLTRLNGLLDKYKAIQLEIDLTQAKIECDQIKAKKQATALPTPRVRK